MTERQRNKRRSERYAARYQGDQDDLLEYSKPEKKKKSTKNILTMEQKIKKEQAEIKRKKKLKEANERQMEETVQKILNDCTTKKAKMTIFEKREKKRAELRKQKVITRNVKLILTLNREKPLDRMSQNTPRIEKE